MINNKLMYSENGSINNNYSYKRLGDIVSDARRAGLIDWDRIVDRTRNVQTPNFWTTPSSIVKSCARSYDIDWWKNQEYRPECFIEKDALIGVLETACEPWHCSYFSCRGYTSDSEIWGAAQRMDQTIKEGKIPIIFHLGDHDPSGIDMSRDILDRINLFSREVHKIEVKRLALNMDQIQQYNPPPNPAKQADTRFEGYQKLYGDESWELDALDPTTISGIIEKEMREIIDFAAWEESERERDEGRRLLGEVSSNWPTITENL